MVTLRVNRTFRDVVKHVDRKVGDAFEVTEERAAHIESVLPGYVTRETVHDEPADGEGMPDKKPAPRRKTTRKAG